VPHLHLAASVATMRFPTYTILLLLAASSNALAADKPVHMSWDVDGVAREALVYAPPAAKSTPSPLMFTFHGHGGTMNHAAASFAYQRHWPEAIVVYMQGLNTPGMLTDPEGKKPGWQKTFGDQNDRDLKFFDAVLTRLTKECRVDAKRIYATGHSNGGGFTYFLWAARGDVLAAVAPCAAAAKPEFRQHLRPKPVLHMAGENDPLVKFAWQQRTIEQLRKLNGCGEGQPWGEHCTLYPSPQGTPVVTYIHPGGHKFPPEVAPVIVKFFKQHAKPR
jgi:polyhydroxybutyrate depolymerase